MAHIYLLRWLRNRTKRNSFSLENFHVEIVKVWILFICICVLRQKVWAAFFSVYAFIIYISLLRAASVKRLIQSLSWWNIILLFVVLCVCVRVFCVIVLSWVCVWVVFILFIIFAVHILLSLAMFLFRNEASMSRVQMLCKRNLTQLIAHTVAAQQEEVEEIVVPVKKCQNKSYRLLMALLCHWNCAFLLRVYRMRT